MVVCTRESKWEDAPGGSRIQKESHGFPRHFRANKCADCPVRAFDEQSAGMQRWRWLMGTGNNHQSGRPYAGNPRYKPSCKHGSPVSPIADEASIRLGALPAPLETVSLRTRWPGSFPVRRTCRTRRGHRTDRVKLGVISLIVLAQQIGEHARGKPNSQIDVAETKQIGTHVAEVASFQ